MTASAPETESDTEGDGRQTVCVTGACTAPHHAPLTVQVRSLEHKHPASSEAIEKIAVNSISITIHSFMDI